MSSQHQAIVDALRSVAPIAEHYSPGGNLIRADWEGMAHAVEAIVAPVPEDTAKKVVNEIREMIKVQPDEDVVDAVKGELVSRDQVIAELKRELEIANAIIDAAKAVAPVAVPVADEPIKPVDPDAAPAG